MAEVTADGDVIVGRRRPKNNPLIRRIEVGKPCQHNDLPPLPSDYTFGAPLKRDAEGAGDVMLTWRVHNPPTSKMTYDFGRDFVTLNRQSVASKCITAKHIADFRQNHDARIKPKVSTSKPSIVPVEVVRDPHRSFGAPTERCESVADLIQNRWEFEWVAEQRTRCEAIEAAKSSDSKKRSLASPMRTTKTMQLQAALTRAKANTPSPIAHTFSLPQFRNVPSRFSMGAASPSLQGNDDAGDYESDN